jgi:hypothetical protein
VRKSRPQIRTWTHWRFVPRYDYFIPGSGRVAVPFVVQMILGRLGDKKINTLFPVKVEDFHDGSDFDFFL